MVHVEANERNRVFAEEAAVVDAQTLLHGIMEEKRISRAELARLMNVSRARVTQIFSEDCSNFTVRLLARALHAMGEELYVGRAKNSQHKALDDFMVFVANAYTANRPQWIADETLVSEKPLGIATANDNIFNSLAEVREARETYEEMAA